MLSECLWKKLHRGFGQLTSAETFRRVFFTDTRKALSMQYVGVRAIEGICYHQNYFLKNSASKGVYPLDPPPPTGAPPLCPILEELPKNAYARLTPHSFQNFWIWP